MDRSSLEPQFREMRSNREGCGAFRAMRIDYSGDLDPVRRQYAAGAFIKRRLPSAELPIN